MQRARGLPIAAYLGLMLALALAAAFIAVLAIIIWLPPRPPDVMRADDVAEHFEAGYDYMIEVGRPLNESGMIWQVHDAPPIDETEPDLAPTRVLIARRLDLRAAQVAIAANHIARPDVFVFRVREIEQIAREAERSAREIERHARASERHQREVERAQARTERMERLAEQRAAEMEQSLRGRGAAPSEADIARIEAQAQAAVRVAEARVAEAEARLRAREFEASEVQVRAAENVLALPAVPPAPPAAPSPPELPQFAPAPAGVALISGFQIGAQLPDGRWLSMRQGRNWAEIGWIGRAALVIGATLAVLTLLLILFARRLTRPIRNFASAVQAVGVDPQSAPVDEEGPDEIRGAARAVNTMQARLRALIADRTKTLAAVAHDMRTPLMRLRLAAEHAAPEQRDKMAKEIEEVEALVASFIAFARDDPAEEARVRLDLSALLQSIADDQSEAGREASFCGEERIIITGQSLGLKRLFSNLVDNALKYGAVARITLTREEGRVRVDVADDGPGVPADQRQSVFEPFVRLDANGARGAGLGLAAAYSIARAHGGDIVILDAEKGALVRVTLAC